MGLKNATAASGSETGAEPIETLEDALSFKLYRINAMNERTGGHLFRDKFGLTLLEWRILGLVVGKSPATMREIKKMMLMDQGLLSRTVKKMCAAGLLRNKVHPSDRRKSVLHATAAGSELHNECIAFTRLRNDKMTAGLTGKERAEFTRLLDRLLDDNMNMLVQREIAHE